MENIAIPSYVGLTTEQIVEGMLTENTGRHFLDSGGAYGRNWERNQGRSFAEQPVVMGKFGAWRHNGPPRLEADFSISLYHWMVHALEFDIELQNELEEYMARPENEDASWLAMSEAFADHLYELGRLDCEPKVFNTYNDTDYIHLTQTLQYVTLSIGDGGDDWPTHVIVHVHGGCDVRGGYTAPKCFKLKGEWYSLLELASISGIDVGGDTWWTQEPTLRPGSLEASYRNSSNVDDPLDLALYTEDYLVDSLRDAGFDPSTIEEIESAITNCNALMGAIRNGQSLPLTKPAEETLRDLEQRMEELKEDQLTALIQGVGLLAQSALLFVDEKLYLVDGDKDTAVEVIAFSHIG